MANLGGTFDASQVDPAQDYSPLPAGEYKAQIIASEMKATKARNGQFLALEMEILDGEHKGRRVFDRLNLVNPNPQAVEIAQRTLSAICHATGVMAVSDSDQLHFKPLVVTVALEPRNDRPDLMTNAVKGYKAAQGATTSAFSQTKAAPVQAAPVAQGMPWQRKAS